MLHSKVITNHSTQSFQALLLRTKVMLNNLHIFQFTQHMETGNFNYLIRL